MTDHQQMRFRTQDGRTEILWVTEIASREFRVLNVPVWVYGISVGSLVTGIIGTDGIWDYVTVSEPSPGGTVRVMVPESHVASQFYLQRLLVEAARRGIGIGPATFLDPALVAIHVHVKSDVERDLSDLLSDLTEEGRIEKWEYGDPDPSDDEQPVEYVGDSVLAHPEPTSDRDKYFVL